jgi:hypothetical protein
MSAQNGNLANFGPEVKSALLDRNLKLSSLADELHMCHGTVSRIASDLGIRLAWTTEAERAQLREQRRAKA